jgi:uncharacterized membrane protein YhiD involved in acid resistance
MDLTAPAPLSVPSLLLNLFLGLLLSLLVSFYYVKYGKSLSNRGKFAPFLPMLTLVTLLVISIVKSSLALSLGLVGALSIVRFRTAIKDPEELIFLFFAIAIGLGMGADQRVPTMAAFAVIMIYLLIRALLDRRYKPSQSLYLNIQLPNSDDNAEAFTRINNILAETLDVADLRRLDSHNDKMQLTYYFSAPDSQTLTTVMGSLHSAYPMSSVSIIEQNNLLGA